MRCENRVVVVKWELECFKNFERRKIKPRTNEDKKNEVGVAKMW